MIAAQNENFAFGPASSIKVLLHLYMHDQVEAGAAAFTDQVTLYAGTSGSCPNGAAVLGTEDLDDSAAKMMRVSDNPATRAQYEHWVPAPATINAYATSGSQPERLEPADGIVLADHDHDQGLRRRGRDQLGGQRADPDDVVRLRRGDPRPQSPRGPASAGPLHCSALHLGFGSQPQVNTRRSPHSANLDSNIE